MTDGVNKFEFFTVKACVKLSKATTHGLVNRDEEGVVFPVNQLCVGIREEKFLCFL